MTLTPEQLEQRRKGITASDAAAISGDHPWRKPIDVWLSKRGIDRPLSPENQLKADTGNAMEGAIAKRYIDLRKPADKEWRILQPRHTWVHPTVTWAMATPDRFVFETAPDKPLPRTEMTHRAKRFPSQCSHLVECKLVGRPINHWKVEEEGLEEQDRIPPYVYAQVQWQGFVTGIEIVDVAMLHGTDFEVFRVPADHAYRKALMEVCYEFFCKNVLDGVEPAVDGSESYRKYLDELYPRNLVEVVGEWEDPTFAALVNQYASARAREGEAAKEKELVGQALKATLQDRSGLKGRWGKVTWQLDKGRVQYSKLVEDLGVPAEKLDEYRKPIRTLRVTSGDK